MELSTTTLFYFYIEMKFIRDILNRVFVGKLKFLNVNTGTGQLRPLALDSNDNLVTGDSGGDIEVSWSDITDKPSTFPPTIGTTGTTAKAGNYTPAWGDVSGKPSTFAPTAHTHTIADIDNLQSELEDRAKLEDIPDVSNFITASDLPSENTLLSKPEIAALTATSTLEEVIAALQA